MKVRIAILSSCSALQFSCFIAVLQLEKNQHWEVVCFAEL